MSAQDFYARVGAALRATRGETGMTQAALAAATGLSRSSITNIENGGQAVLLHQLVDLARALGADPSTILAAGGVEGEPSDDDAAGEDTVRATDLLARLTPMGGPDR